ncbi:MBL fold metallo-hydrolase [Candidatus Parcubacteria bacterium]|nr:MBL fold metallo-hydrolase [Candidatus Parcubacteria bacterium]
MQTWKTVSNYWKEVLVAGLILGNLLVWFLVWQKRPSDLLHVYFFDIGQGDSIFIDSPTHGRVLLDGGRDKKVLTELGKVLPLGDRRIDVMIESHPDADHIGGLPAVVDNFNVGAFLEPGVESPNKVDNALHARVKEKNIPDILARRGMVVNFGDGAKLQILFPNTDVSNWETNDASIVAKLVYGDKSFLLTGDSTKKSEYILLGLNSNILNSDVLKAGHHGSRTSTSLTYAEAVSPLYAVISAGKDNSYGHPHQETLDTLNKVGAKIVSTIDLGTILFETDGKTLVLK